MTKQGTKSKFCNKFSEFHKLLLGNGFIFANLSSVKYKNSIQINAIILLLVFSLNTIILFACALGMDMGFRSQHHENSDAITHQHEEGTLPHHHDKASDSHHHNDADNHQQQLKDKSDNKNNCCNDSVLKFEKLDKTVTNTVKVNFNTPVFVALIHIFYLSDFLSTSQITKHLPVVRWCFPPPPDIRVSIQSFQI